MDGINFLFLEEYKRLDRLCRDMHRSDRGVTSYIDDMKTVSVMGRGSVPSWDRDLGELVRLRHIRNQLTHDMGTLDREMCSQEDVLWVKAFQKKIVEQSDPLSLLRRYNQCPATCSSVDYQIEELPSSHSKNNGAGCLATLMLVFGVLIIFGTIVASI